MMVLSRNEAVSYEKKRLPEDQADARQTLLPCNKTSWRGSRSDRRRGDRRRLWRLERGGARERRLATRNKHDATSDDPTRTKRHKLEKPQLAHTLFLLRIFSTCRTDSWDWSSGSDRTVIWATSSTKSVKKTGQLGNANICGKSSPTNRGVGGLQDLTWLIWDPHSVFRDLDSLFRALTWQRLTGR